MTLVSLHASGNTVSSKGTITSQSLVHAKQSYFTEFSGSTLQTLNAILTTALSGILSFRSRQVWVTSDTAL